MAFPEFVMWRGNHNEANPGDWLWRVAESHLLGRVVVRDCHDQEFTVRRTLIRRTRPKDFMRCLI